MSSTMFICLSWILCAHYSQGLRIVGVFPKVNEDQGNVWIKDAEDLFRIAFEVAEEYNITVHQQRIHYSIHRLNNSLNSYLELYQLCHQILASNGSDIVGIVGPTSSSAARFVASFAGSVGLPLVSYAATSHQLSDLQLYPTFYRTAPSDALLAEAIIGLFKRFEWCTCTILLGNDDYSYDGVRLLRERYHRQLNILDQIVFDSDTNTFNDNLTRILHKSPSRIVLVWARRHVVTAIIRQAINWSLIPGEHVWITTNQINEDILLEYLPFPGFLSVAPIISDQTDLGINQSLRAAACRRLKGENCPAAMEGVYPHAIYAFDAAWTFIQALSKLTTADSLPQLETQSSCCLNFRLNSSNEFFRHLNTTSFPGLSGYVAYTKGGSHDRINGTSYALFHLRRDVSGTKVMSEQLMLWDSHTRTWNLSLAHNKHSNGEPISILNKTPVDYIELNNKHLDILISITPPFFIQDNKNNPSHSQCPSSNKHRQTLRANDGATEICGFFADLLLELQKDLNLTYKITVAEPNTHYHELAAQVAGDDRLYDMVISAIRITSQRLVYADFTTPVLEHYLQIITRKTLPLRSGSLFPFFNPFDWTIWLIIGVIIIYAGALIYFFERDQILIEKKRPYIPDACIGIVRVITNVIIWTNGMQLKRSASRIIVFGVHMLGIILLAIYTADLSSFLTLRQTQPFISSIDDIKNRLVPMDRIGIVKNSAVSDYFEEFISSHYRVLSSPDEIYPMLINHSIDAAIWTGPVLNYAVNNYYCNQLTTVRQGFVKSSFAFVIPKEWKYKRHLDSVILKMKESERLEQMEKKWCGQRKCRRSVYSDDQDSINGIPTFSLDTMSGVFFAFFGVSLLAMLTYMWSYRVYMTSVLRSSIRAS